MNIEVVLLQDDAKLGKRGEVVKVSSGFAQNFLYPHHKAKAATPENLKAFEGEKTRRLKEEADRLSRAQALAKQLKDLSLTIEVSAGEGDKLYGAVNSQDIVEALAGKNILLERKDVHLDEPIKKLGTYQAQVKLHPQISTALKIMITKKI